MSRIELELMSALIQRRAEQDAKWGGPEHDAEHSDILYPLVPTLDDAYVHTSRAHGVVSHEDARALLEEAEQTVGATWAHITVVQVAKVLKLATRNLWERGACDAELDSALLDLAGVAMAWLEARKMRSTHVTSHHRP